MSVLGRGVHLRPLLVSAVLALVLAGCGSSGSETPAETSRTGAQTATAGAAGGSEIAPSAASSPSRTAGLDPTGPTGSATEGQCAWIDAASIHAVSPQLAALPTTGVLTVTELGQGFAGTRRTCTWGEDFRVGFVAQALTFDTAENAQKFMDGLLPEGVAVPGLGDEAGTESMLRTRFKDGRVLDLRRLVVREANTISSVGGVYDPDQPGSLAADHTPLVAPLTALLAARR